MIAAEHVIWLIQLQRLKIESAITRSVATPTSDLRDQPLEAACDFVFVSSAPTR